VNIDYLRPVAANSHGDDRLRLVGERGVVEVRGGKAYVIDDSGTRELPLPPAGNIFTDYMNMLKGRLNDAPGFEDAYRVTEVALLARLSADEDKICYFNDKNDPARPHEKIVH